MTRVITIAQVNASRFFVVLSFITAVVTGVLACSEVASAQASYEVLYTFDSHNLPAALIQATDGNFYGTTESGAVDCGGGSNSRFFQMTPDGTVTVLYRFHCPFDSLEGKNAEAPLIQATDGDLYGTTVSGGAFSDRGTVFRMTLDGAMTVLHSFAGDTEDGAFPQAALIQATDGNFYGTTQAGGAFNAGTVFRMAAGGSGYTILHHFAGPPGDGSSPVAALIQGTDGNFYGTTLQGGSGNGGTVFQMTPDGAVTVLHAFTGMEDGSLPHAPLIQATDGALYGTTFGTGLLQGQSVIFRLMLP
jgi:uncharacterized repeat protein (TIGR03803 family)